jgi:hypothetical protein
MFPRTESAGKPCRMCEAGFCCNMHDRFHASWQTHVEPRPRRLVQFPCSSSVVADAHQQHIVQPRCDAGRQAHTHTVH